MRGSDQSSPRWVGGSRPRSRRGRATTHRAILVVEADLACRLPPPPLIFRRRAVGRRLAALLRCRPQPLFFLCRDALRRRPKAAISQRPRSTAAEGRRRGQVPCRLNDYNCNRNQLPPPTSVLYFWGTGAVAISGRFSAPPPPHKRSSRPSLSLYLDFPLTSTLTQANTCCERPLPSLQVRVRVRALFLVEQI